ncbi:MAG: hypothetical protein IKP81_10235 [Paludibacteraceae bacterium]|nr:hypothetical protein [Paludibacteraceae bacterium]MBR6105417.1 hypothetical protein [Paludibacteraceae bacterium]MCR5567880.1 hypothetical protein [Paludibacteraceae bacterium]
MNEYINPSKEESIIFVNIKKSYNCTDKSSIYYRPSTYEATRKYWRMSIERAKKASLLIGHVDGIVKEVIKPSNCSKSKEPGLTNRVVFEGEELNNSPYLGKLITNIVTIGQNPVNYYNI